MKIKIVLNSFTSLNVGQVSKNIYRLLAIIIFLLVSGFNLQVSTALSDSACEYTQIQGDNSSRKFVIAYLAEGYTRDEMDIFLSNAREANDLLFNNASFIKYKNYFNVYAIKTPSNTSIMGKTYFTDTFFATSLLKGKTNMLGACPDAGQVKRVTENSLRNANLGEEFFPVVIANSKLQGCVTRWSGDKKFSFITQDAGLYPFVHEFGHLFAGLEHDYKNGNHSNGPCVMKNWPDKIFCTKCNDKISYKILEKEKEKRIMWGNGREITYFSDLANEDNDKTSYAKTNLIGSDKNPEGYKSVNVFRREHNDGNFEYWVEAYKPGENVGTVLIREPVPSNEAKGWAFNILTLFVIPMLVAGTLGTLSTNENVKKAFRRIIRGN